MTRRGTVENLIRRYGETVSYGGEKFRAILRPYQTGGTSLPGTRYFLYTGPAAHKLAEGGTVSAQGNDFSVRRSDVYLFCGETLYVRAVLARILPESGIRLERGARFSPGRKAVRKKPSRAQKRKFRGALPLPPPYRRAQSRGS